MTVTMSNLAALTAAVDFLESNIVELRADIGPTERAPRPPIVPQPYTEPAR